MDQWAESFAVVLTSMQCSVQLPLYENANSLRKCTKIQTRRRSRGTNRTIHQPTSDFCQPHNKYGDHRFASQNINFDSK